MTSVELMDRDGVLATLGYKPEKSWKSPMILLEKSELCIRCNKKVYPVEKIDVGGLYHRSCFKCKTCNIGLNLRNYHRDVHPVRTDQTKEIYCRVHVPTANSVHVDSDALGIRHALDSQKFASTQLQGTGYQYKSNYNPDVIPGNIDPDNIRRKKVRRRSTLRNSNDFQKFGVYDAQVELEAVHKQEEDELYKEMFNDRKHHIDKLEAHISREKNQTVKELVDWFEKRNVSEDEKKIGLRKIENFYSTQREQRLQLLIQRLTMEEQAAVARMIEKHSQEMLVLIQQKEEEAEKAMRIEFRMSDLLSEEKVNEMFYTDESEEEKDLTESFSQASYQVQQVEEYQRDNVQFFKTVDKAESEHSHDLERPSEPSPPLSDTRSRMNSELGADKPRALDRQHSRSLDLLETGKEDRKPLTIRNKRRSKDDSVVTGRNTRANSSSTGTQNNRPSSKSAMDFKKVPLMPPFQASYGDLNLSQQLLNVYPPLDDLEFGLSPEGEVIVKVHAAQHANLIGDELRSHHYCTDPNAPAGYFYDVSSKSPKPCRHVLPQAAARKASGKVGTPDPNKKFMKFMRPGEEGYESEGKSGARAKARGKAKQDENDVQRSSSQPRSTSQHSLKSQGGSTRGRGEQGGSVGGRADLSDQEHKSRGRSAASDVNMKNFGSPERTPAIPKVAPPKTKKRSLYTKAEEFESLDNNAIKQTRQEHKTFTDLVRQLSKRCENELQRVRSIFRWITAKNLNELTFSDTLDSDSPMGLLRGIKLGVETYHNLFKRLCSYAGLHCVIIDGYSKGVGYKPGDQFQGNQFRNQWTAVHVDGTWRFINCNWGARHVKDRKEKQLTYKCDEFYFLTDPEDHIFQHFPDNPKWQLLEGPLTIDQFTRLPVLKSPFFNNNLRLPNVYHGTLDSTSGDLEVKLIAPKSVGFTAQLKSKSGLSNTPALQDRILIRRVKQDVIFFIVLPATGVFYLEIFCNNDKSDSESENLDNACSFRIACHEASQNAVVSFPPVGCFGRTIFTKKYKIEEETHPDPYIKLSGELIIAFLCDVELDVSQTLMSWDHRNKKFESVDRFAFVVHRSDRMLTYVVHCPKRGGYVFSIMVKDSDGVKCVYRYYIQCRSPTEFAYPFPKSSMRWKHCRLVEPMRGELPVRSRQHFRIESATAIEIVISVNNTWHSLQKSGHIWQGNVSTGDDKTKLSVFGRFDQNKEKYIPLLEYKVKNMPATRDEVKSLMKYL